MTNEVFFMHNNMTAEQIQEKLLAFDTSVSIARDKLTKKRKELVHKFLTWAGLSVLCVLLSYAVLSSWWLAGCFAGIALCLSVIAGVIHIWPIKLKRRVRKDIESQLDDIQRYARKENITLNIPKNLVRYL
jgi:hypothetical protein